MGYEDKKRSLYLIYRRELLLILYTVILYSHMKQSSVFRTGVVRMLLLFK
jgi:hypothetical protein